VLFRSVSTMTQRCSCAMLLRNSRPRNVLTWSHTIGTRLPNYCSTRLAKTRYQSSWGKGEDFLAGSLAAGVKPKIILDSYGPAGFDVINVIKKVQDDETSKSGTLLMNGSILAFPQSCFLWKIEDISEVTILALAPVILHRPKVEYLFLGSETPMQLDGLLIMKKRLREFGITFEQLDLANTMGTFNILNGEDRVVAAALIVPKEAVESAVEKKPKA